VTPSEAIWRRWPRALLLVEAGRVTLASDSALRLFGRSLEGERAADLFDDEGLDTWLQLCAGSSAPIPRRARRRGAEDVQRLDGWRVGPGPAVLLELRPQAQASERIAELDRRIATLSATHRELRRQATELETQNARLRDFVTMLGHELRNPLVGIATAFDLLEGEGDETKARALEVGTRQLGHVRRLIDDLLDLRRVEQGELSIRKAPCDVGAVVGRAVEPMATTFAERGIELTVQLPEAPLVIEGDETRLLQALTHLVRNALQHCGPGGHVTVEAATRGDEVRLSVADDGEGFAPELGERLFEPFHQAPQALDRSRGGIGAGLTLARRLVELHGGALEAESPGPGQGATFRVRLPWRRPSQAPAATSPDELPPLSILVVDDQVDAVELLRMMLERDGHTVREAYDGNGALSAVADALPDVVLLDIGLPDLDGFEVARRLRARHGDQLLVVALSGYGSAEDKARGREAGFDHHLVKPVRGKELRAELARLWAARA